MEKTSSDYRKLVKILQEELLPAMGCTEPIAISYCAAVAKEYLGAEPTEVFIEASGNIIKNVKSVVVPNTDGLKGIEAAAAAGIIAGRADKQLEVISQVSEAQKEEIRDFLNRVPVKVRLAQSPLIFDIVATLYYGEFYTKVRIANYHTNIVLIEKNGNILKEESVTAGVEDGLEDRTFMTVEKIVDFADTVDLDDVRDVIARQVKYNTAIAQEGILGDYGANVGTVILNSCGTDVRARAKALAAAGSDARMNGCELPVIINSGSGNQGIAVSLPVIVYARDMDAGEEKMYRALVLSNLLAIHQKTGIGRLSAYCGAISAGAAAGCGVAYLKDGSYRAIAHTLVNALAIASGVICDGAKASCAGKIATAVETGLFGYDMYVNGQEFRGGDGIVKKGVENTIRSVGRLGRDGMFGTDKEILRIMVGD